MTQSTTVCTMTRGLMTCMGVVPSHGVGVVTARLGCMVAVSACGSLRATKLRRVSASTSPSVTGAGRLHHE